MSDQTTSSQVSELKVSGHTMALEPGIYCVFTAPGSQPPLPESGLPIVRISTAPGPDAGQVDVAGLSEDGWVGPDSATLVRVKGATAHVLVTVYQSKTATADAPQLQVIRIAGPVQATAAAPGAQPGPAAGQRSVQMIGHIYGRGDVGAAIGEWMGEPGSRRWIEGFGIAAADGVPASDIEYQAVLGRGWLSPWSEGGQFCGSRGMSLPVLGLRVRLRGASAATKRISLEATFVDGSKVGPVGDGEPCEAESLAALEAFRLVIEDAAGATAPAPKKPAKAPAKAAAKPARAPKPEAPVAPTPVAAAPKARAPRTPAPTRRR